MCFGLSRREAYDSPPPRRAYYGHDAYSQYTYNKDYKASKNKKKRRARQNAATIAGGGDGGGGGGDGGGGCC